MPKDNKPTKAEQKANFLGDDVTIAYEKGQRYSTSKHTADNKRVFTIYDKTYTRWYIIQDDGTVLVGERTGKKFNIDGKDPDDVVTRYLGYYNHVTVTSYDGTLVWDSNW